MAKRSSAPLPSIPTPQLRQEVAAEIWMTALSDVTKARQEAGMPMFGFSEEVRSLIDEEVVAAVAFRVFQLAGALPMDRMLSADEVHTNG